MASVAEVAAAAGLAKGTVYLYFPGKEEMLLALHERHTARLLRALHGADGERAPDRLRRHLRGRARALHRAARRASPLTSWCFAMMDRGMPIEAAVAFKVRVGERGRRRRHRARAAFPDARARATARACCSTASSLIIGLWQFVHPNQRFARALDRAGAKVYMRDYDAEIRAAIYALWSGTIAPLATWTRSRASIGERKEA